MAVQTFVDSFNTGTGVAGTTIARTGYGFQPKAFVIWTSGRVNTTDSVGALDLNLSIGFAASATQRACTGGFADTAATAATGCTHRDDAVLAELSASAITGLLDIQSFDSDGLTFVVDDQFVASLRVHVWAIGGSDITNAFVTTAVMFDVAGEQSRVDVGFRPDASFFISSSILELGEINIFRVDFPASLGFAASSTRQGTTALVDLNGADPTDTARYSTDIECLAVFPRGNQAGTSLQSRAAFVSHDAQGFTWNTLKAEPNVISYLCIRGGRWDSGVLTTRADTTPFSATGLASTPRGIFVFSHATSESTQDISQATAVLGLGAASSTSNRGSQGIYSEDNVSPSDCNSIIEFDALLARTNAAGTIESLVDISSINSDGFTLVMDDTDATNTQFLQWVAVMDSPSVATSASIDYEVGLELVAGSFTNIRDDVLQISIARSLASLFSELTPGEATFEAQNQTGKYSPDNTSSPFTGLLKPNIKARVIATQNSVQYPLFKGLVDEYALNPSLEGPRNVAIRCRDEVKQLRKRIITTSLFVDYNVGSFFTEVLSASAVSSYRVDSVADQIQFGWFRQEGASGAISEILRSGFYFAAISGDGVLRIKNRYFDQSPIAVGSYSEMFGLNYALSDDRVLNRVRIEGVPRQTLAVNTVAYIGGPLPIPASGFLNFLLEYLDPLNNEPSPAVAMITPVSSADYLANTASAGTGTDRTSTTSVSVTFFGQTAVNTVFNGSADDVFLTKYQLRGQPVSRRPRFTLESNDSSSQAVYGIQEFTLSSDLLSSATFSKDYADFLKSRNKEPAAGIALTLRNQFPDVLDIELGDAVHVQNSITGINSLYITKALEHTIATQPGQIHELRLTLDRFRDQELLILDHTTFGKLDIRKLGL